MLQCLIEAAADTPLHRKVFSSEYEADMELSAAHRFEANRQPWQSLSCSLPWSQDTVVLEASQKAREGQVGVQACQQAAAERTTGLSCTLCCAKSGLHFPDV